MRRIIQLLFLAPATRRILSSATCFVIAFVIPATTFAEIVYENEQCFASLDYCAEECGLKSVYDVDTGSLYSSKQTDFYRNCSIACVMGFQICELVDENHCFEFATEFYSKCPSTVHVFGKPIYMNNADLNCDELKNSTYEYCSGL